MNSTIVFLRSASHKLSTALQVLSEYLEELELPKPPVAELRGVTVHKVRNPKSGRMIKPDGTVAKKLAKEGLLPV